MLRTRTLALLALVALAATTGLADAGVGTPVVVRSVGPKRVRLEIAETPNLVLPCDAFDNVILYRGWIEPGQKVHVASPSGNVCWRQTSESFPELDWSESRVVMTRKTCRRAPCPPPAPRIELTMSSSDPSRR